MNNMFNNAFSWIYNLVRKLIIVWGKWPCQESACLLLSPVTYPNQCKNDRNGGDEVTQGLRVVIGLAEDLSSAPGADVWETQDHL